MDGAATSNFNAEVAASGSISGTGLAACAARANLGVQIVPLTDLQPTEGPAGLPRWSWRRPHTTITAGL